MNWSLRKMLLTLLVVSLAGYVLVAGALLFAQRQAMFADRGVKTQHMVEAAMGVLTHFEAQEKAATLSREKAQEAAKAVLTEMRFENGNYFFVTDLDTVTVLHPGNPKLVGKNLSEIIDAKGKSIGQAIREVIASKGEGAADYYWKKKPDDSSAVPKVSYVKKFAPWGWIVGTGSYADDVMDAFWSSAFKAMLLVAVVLAIAAALYFHLFGRILRQLGGEPAYAAEAVRAFAGGDLRRQVNSGNGESLLGSIRQMQESLSRMIQQIRDTARDLSSHAGDIANASKQVADGSEEQSAAAASMATAVEEMTVSINHVADNAKDAQAITEQAGSLAQRGNVVIHSAVDEIKSISQSLSETADSIGDLAEKVASISSVTKVIKDIADQTNLLALNAAIEAARAGEQGRGFAVVADEVRQLAERTAVSTTEIAKTIGTVQESATTLKALMDRTVEQAANGVNLVSEGGDAVKELYSNSQRVVEVAQEIAHALQEQRTATNEIARHVERLTSMSDRNAQTVRNVANGTSRLNDLASSLSSSVSRFQV